MLRTIRILAHTLPKMIDIHSDLAQNLLQGSADATQMGASTAESFHQYRPGHTPGRYPHLPHPEHHPERPWRLGLTWPEVRGLHASGGE
ncbi:hypothetical protein DFAR_670004 [Desulfarculales bacterium]